MPARRNTPPLTEEVRKAIEKLVACNPKSKASPFLAAMLEAHSQRQQKRERRKEQASARRKIVVPKLIEHEGRVQTLSAWCREKNLSYSTVHGRLERGNTVEEALSPDSRLPHRSQAE